MDADGDLLEQARLGEDEGVHDEYLPGRCSRVAASVGALVDLPEIGRIEAKISPDRCCVALSALKRTKSGFLYVQP